MLSIVQVETEMQRRQVRELFLEYLRWVAAEFERAFAFGFDALQAVEADMATLHQFAPLASRWGRCCVLQLREKKITIIRGGKEGRSRVSFLHGVASSRHRPRVNAQGYQDTASHAAWESGCVA